MERREGTPETRDDEHKDEENEEEKDEDDEYDNEDGDQQGEGEEDFVQAKVSSLQPATRALHPVIGQVSINENKFQI